MNKLSSQTKAWIVIFLCLLANVAMCFAGTLEEDLIQYKPRDGGGPIFEAFANSRFNNDLEAGEQADPSAHLLLLNRPPVPVRGSYYLQMIDYLRSLGVSSLSDFQAKADSVPDELAARLIAQFRAQVVLPTGLDEVSISELWELSGDEFPDLTVLHMTDQWYIVPNLEALGLLNAQLNASKFKYLREQRDCDDFVRIWRGFLSQIGFGNMTAGYCEIEFTKFDGKPYYHAVVMLMIEVESEYRWAIYDPQLQPGTLTWLNGQTKYKNLKVNHLFW